MIGARAELAENQLPGLLSVTAANDALPFTSGFVEALVAKPAGKLFLQNRAFTVFDDLPVAFRNLLHFGLEAVSVVASITSITK